LLRQARTREYYAYWNLRETQSDPSQYDADHRITLTPDEIAFYDDDATIETLEDSRTQQYHTLHEIYGSLGDTRNDDYIYQPTVNEQDAIRDSIKVWTEPELLSLRPARDLLEITDSEFVVEEPNLIAAEVDLDIREGIGRYDNGVTIDVRSDNGAPVAITLDEASLIQTADPNDIVYLQAEPVEVLARLGGDAIDLFDTTVSWSDLGFEIGQFIYLESNTRDTTDEGRFLEVIEVAANVMRVNLDAMTGVLQPDRPRNILIAPAETDPAKYDDAPFIRVLRREDIDIDSTGPIQAVSSRHVYIGSEGDLNLDGVRAGNEQTDPQRVQIKAGGNVMGTSGNASPTITGGRVVVEAAAGRVGSLDNPLVLDATGYVTARAQDEVVLRHAPLATAQPDLTINQIFSRDAFIDVASEGNIQAHFAESRIELSAPDSFVRTSAGIGSEDRPLGVRTNGGSLTATAGGDIWLNSTEQELGLRQILSIGGDVSITSEGSILDRVDVVDPSDPLSPDADPILGNPAADIVGRSVHLVAQFGTIGTGGDEIDIDSNRGATTGGRIDAEALLNIYFNETVGDLALGLVQTPETAFIAALDGNITDGDRSDPSISSGKTWLFASGSVGQSNDFVKLNTENLEAFSANGDVLLFSDTPLTIGGVVDSPAANGEPSPQTSSVQSTTGATRFGDGIQTPGSFFINSRESIDIIEDIVANDRITIWASKHFVLPAKVRLKSDERLNISTRYPALAFNIDLFGSLEAPTALVVGSDLADRIVVQPSTLIGTLVTRGGAGDDTIVGSPFDESIYGDEGDDIIDAGGGIDFIAGGEGFDTILNVDADDIVGVMRLPSEPVDEEAPTDQAITILEWLFLDPEDTVSLRILEGGDTFVLIDNELRIAPSANLQARANYTRDVTIEATHAQGGITRETFTIEILADDDAPLGLRMADPTDGPVFHPDNSDGFFGGITERVSGATIGRVQVYDPEGDSAFVMTPADERFEIIDGILSLRQGEYLDMSEVAGGHFELNVMTSDPGNPALSISLNVGIRVFENSRPWQNTDNFYDVTNDGTVTALDALRVINRLNRNSTSILPAARSFDQTNEFYDVSGDGVVSALDALRIINELNRQEPEFESIAPLSGGLALTLTDQVMSNTDRWKDDERYLF
ncbi:MAG: dockerin type I domain-containing protein, partial [Rubripirellula sp.]